MIKDRPIMSALVTLQIVMLVLKCIGAIECSWILVFAPLWLGVTVFMSAMTLVLWFEYQREKKAEDEWREWNKNAINTFNKEANGK